MPKFGKSHHLVQTKKKSEQKCYPFVHFLYRSICTSFCLSRHSKIFSTFVNSLKKKPSEMFCRKRTSQRCPTQVFSCKICEVLRTPILKNILKRLLLSLGNASVKRIVCKIKENFRAKKVT